MDDQFTLTTSDVADILGVTSERVRQLAKAGMLDHQQTTRGFRLFRRSDVERLKEARNAATSKA